MECDAIWKEVQFLEGVAITKFSVLIVTRTPAVDRLAYTQLSTTTQQIPCQFYKGQPWGYKGKPRKSQEDPDEE